MEFTDLASRQEKMKLLLVVNAISFFFSHRLSLAKTVQQAGYEVHVAAPMSCSEQESVAELIRTGFYFHPIPMQRKSLNPIRALGGVYALYRLYRNLRPDIIHHFSMKPILYGSLAARILSVPAVLNTFTGLGYLFVSPQIKARVLRQCLRLSFYFVLSPATVRCVFQNLSDLERVQKSFFVKPQRSELIKGSGLPLADFPPLREPMETIPVVVLPARLLWDKGVGEFVAAAEQLKTRMEIRMVLVGAIDLENPRAITEKQLNTWIKSQVIEYWGFQKNIREVFRQCHIVCLPSYREGLPRVLLEAAACGRSIVTTDVPGCRDVVRHRDNGLLVAPRNPSALAEAIHQLATDKALRARLIQRGQERVAAEFSSDRIDQQTLLLYEKVRDNSAKNTVR